jgi:hypothetical protein
MEGARHEEKPKQSDIAMLKREVKSYLTKPRVRACAAEIRNGCGELVKVGSVHLRQLSGVIDIEFRQPLTRQWERRKRDV